MMFSFNTQPPEGGCFCRCIAVRVFAVSTHSRLKAAVRIRTKIKPKMLCFNTQPPEGGCYSDRWVLDNEHGFNTQPPEGGCRRHQTIKTAATVSTHSRLKAAVKNKNTKGVATLVSTHSRLKAADFSSAWVVGIHEFQHTAA